jgi:pyruvate/2-oxoglutarate/acetoin dehydrogenase E1 component
MILKDLFRHLVLLSAPPVPEFVPAAPESEAAALASAVHGALEGVHPISELPFLHPGGEFAMHAIESAMRAGEALHGHAHTVAVDQHGAAVGHHESMFHAHEAHHVAHHDSGHSLHGFGHMHGGLP